MKYETVITATFVRRPNRFIAVVLIDGKEEIVHVKNTGRCRELLQPGARVILADYSHIATRKTKYSLIAVWKENMLVNMDSLAPNEVVYEAMKANRLPALAGMDQIKREAAFGNSRFDLHFTRSDQDQGYIEIKGVTLEKDSVAMFPDAPTVRGLKHIREMIQAVKLGHQGIIFFLIQMQGPEKFVPNWKMDPDFASALHQAAQEGVEIMVYDSLVQADSIVLGTPLPFEIMHPRS